MTFSEPTLQPKGATIRLALGCDERYPDYALRDFYITARDAVEVPVDLWERYRAAEKEYAAVQDELRKYDK
jgi:hypothetical protein